MTDDERALAAIDLDAALGQLERFCGQPSVAAQDLGMQDMAGLVADGLAQIGAEVESWPTASGHPCVFGRVAGGPGPTLLFYNHYDVQPPEPLEAWRTPPFELTRVGDALYARGTADNKGNLVARLAAVAAWQRAAGGPPGDVLFLVEGGEEVGSPDLPAVVADHKDRLRCDGVLWESGYKDPDDRPILHLGVKGNLYVELVVDTGRVDLHSSYAPLVPNPAWRLVEALTALRDPDGRVRIPGFYDAVRQPDEQDMAMLATIPFDDARWCSNFGIDAFLDGVGGMEAKRRLYMTPTSNIAGLVSGYGGPGSKTVLPATARAKIDFRLVPDQEPEAVLAALRSHLDDSGFPDVEVKVHSRTWPARSRPDSAIAQATIETARSSYGTEPIVLPMTAGSGPLRPFLQHLGAPVVSTGVGHADSNRHAPNENIRLRDFELGLRHVVSIMDAFQGSAQERGA